ncbi:phenylacetate--CoA ligase family protein [Pseudahrensia aquimaris]|uniref:Phenylacetate--CoA ligase family protein n=1 Tax=Pseudahrensia aquimaris TaxID=744461 RepID=A0ABW3FCR5_9HYPH
MSEFFEDREAVNHGEREAALFGRLAGYVSEAVAVSEGLAAHLAGHDLAKVSSREALAALPVLRKSDLMEAQAKKPPFGGFANVKALEGNRVFLSPGPIWEPQGLGADPWGSARALYAAGFRRGDVVHNALSHHMTPGGFILDSGALAVGCTVFPAGIGNTEMQVEAARDLQPVAYVGTPDYLKVILDKADEMQVDLSCITKALVSGGALFPSMRDAYRERGVNVLQCYATADLGTIAYESLVGSAPGEGMIVNEDLIVEICRPGTGDPVAEGEVGELVVTNFSLAYPLVRFATGDLSAVLPGESACGRTNMRIKGWMGRADQRTKVKGMFVDPKQIDMLVKRHNEIAAARLSVVRDGDSDAMRLDVVASGQGDVDPSALQASLREITKLGGEVILVETLPNDGKVIDDQRDYES